MIKETKITQKELIWQVVIFYAIAAVAFEAPFSIVFNTHLQTWQIYLDAFLSSIFLADFIYNLHKAKKKSKTTTEALLNKRPRWVIASLIIVDLIAIIPFDLISSFMHLSATIGAIKLFRLFRLIRVVKLFSMLGNFNAVPKQLKVMFGITAALIAVHWISCGWILIESVPTTDRYTAYNKAFYWAVTTLTTIGYGDITPSSNIARLYTMVIMIIGVGVYGVIIGNFSRMLTQADRYKEKSKEKLQDLSAFLKYYKIPPKTQATVYAYYNHLLTKRLSDNDNKIISDLPGPIQNELKTYMNMKLISNVPLFKNCSHGCLKNVASSLEQLHYSPGKNIINIGEIGDEMFIIAHGQVDVILENGQVIAQLNEGQYFGEIALLQKAKRNANIKASAYCDIYKLSKNSFLEVIEKYPSLRDDIEETIEARKNPQKSA